METATTQATKDLMYAVEIAFSCLHVFQLLFFWFIGVYARLTDVRYILNYCSYDFIASQLCTQLKQL